MRLARMRGRIRAQRANGFVIQGTPLTGRLIRRSFQGRILSWPTAFFVDTDTRRSVESVICETTFR